MGKNDIKFSGKSMKKLSVFIYSMAGGGAERVVSNLLGELAKKYEIHLILMNERIYYEIPKQVKIHFIEKSAPFENGVKKLLKLPFLAIKYKHLCEKLCIDIHFVWMNRPCYVCGFARIFGLKGAVIFNECSTPSVIYNKNNFKSIINKALIRFFYPKADLIMPNSLGNLLDLNKNFNIKKEKMWILYNAIDLKSIIQLSNENINLTKPFFLTIGRLDNGKNHALLIKAFSKLKNNKFDLVILGEGVLRNKLEILIKDLKMENKIHLMGFEKNPYKYISKCYAFVFVSLFEGFSNALIEALACGKFIISSDHKSGARELLGQNEWGILVCVDDEVATKNAMQKAIDDENLVKFYEKKARNRALFFDKTKIVNELFDKIEQIYGKYKKVV